MLTLAILLYLFGAVAAGRDTTPVFILDFDNVLAKVNVEPNPLTIMNSSDFGKIVDSTIRLSEVIIIFVEESFCFEDISLKDKYGTPFYHLHQSLKENHVKFLPSVSQPYGTLKEKLYHLDYNIFYIDDSKAKLNIYERKFRHFYVYFKDPVNETRASALRRHDLSMREVYFVVRQLVNSPIVAFYTGKNNPIAVESLHFKPVKPYQVEEHPVTISSSAALFKFIDLYATIGSRRSKISQIPVVAEETLEKNRLITRMSYSDFELEFHFDLKKERWTIETVMLLEHGEEVGRKELRAGAPWSRSYTCSDPLVLVNLRDGSSLTISHYQLQPFQDDQTHYTNPHDITTNKREGRDTQTQFSKVSPATESSDTDSSNTDSSNTDSNNTKNKKRFDESVDCGPYFNINILVGLLVTFCFLGILTYGSMALYNCHSNDRYDDSHGKPLVIAFEAGGS